MDASGGKRPPPHRVARIGFLGGGAPTLVEAFEQEMRKLRYVEGENIVIEKRILRPNSADLAAQAAELAHMNLDLIVAGALVHALEVRKNNPAMPMVIATCPGMVSNGFAKSLRIVSRNKRTYYEKDYLSIVPDRITGWNCRRSIRGFQ